MTTQEKILKLAKTADEVRVRIAHRYWVKISKVDAYDFINKNTHAIVDYGKEYIGTGVLYLETDKDK